MFVQVVTFSLEGISEEGYLDVATGLAPRFGGLPGLLAKIWLENPGGNRYGAVYFWEDIESMERFGNSNLFEGDTGEFSDFVSEEFRVLENLTAQTQPVLELVPPRGVTAARPSMAPATQATVAEAPAAKAPAAPAPAGRAPVKKAPVKKAPAVKAPAQKAPAKKVPVKKAPAVKAPVKKATAPKKAAVKKSPAKKAPARTTKAAAPAKKSGRKAVR